MSTMRSLRRQSMYGHQWKRRSLTIQNLTFRQRLYLALMSTFLGRTLLKILGRKA